MKKRKILIAIISVAVLIALGLTVYEPSSSKETESSTLNESIDILRKGCRVWEKGMLDKIMSENENVPLSDLTAYKYDNALDYELRRRHFYNICFSGIIRWELTSFQNCVNIDHIYRIDDETIAVISKLKNKGIEAAFMVTVFSNYYFNPDAKNSEHERWDMTGETYFIGDIYSFTDYSNIKIGDNIKTLCDVDDTINYDLMFEELSCEEWDKWKNDVEAASNTDWDETEYTIMIYKLLKDGLMTVEYSSQTGIISSIDFYPYSEDMPLDCVKLKLDDLLNYILNEG